MNILGRDHIVLLYIVNHGPSAGYTISKKTSLTQRRVYASLQHLLKEKILSVYHIEKNRPGQDKKIYGLTFEGLITALNISTDNWDIIASHFSKLLPLILGKWTFFMNNDVKEEAVLRLKHSVDFFKQDLSEFHVYLPGSFWADHTIQLTTSFYLFDIWNMYPGFESDALIRKCVRDPEIKEFLTLTYWFVKKQLLLQIKEIEDITREFNLISNGIDELASHEYQINNKIYLEKIPKLVHGL